MLTKNILTQRSKKSKATKRAKSKKVKNYQNYQNYQKLPQFPKIAHKCEISHAVKKNDRILMFYNNV